MDIDGILTVSKVIIAAAWVDNELTPKEVESLKDLVFRFSNLFPSQVGISARQWAELEIYMDSPVTGFERERLLLQLQEYAFSDEDKADISKALEDMVRSDGEITEDEKAVFKQISDDLRGLRPGLVGQIGRSMKTAIKRRSKTIRQAPNREEYLEEYLDNRILFRLREREGFGSRPVLVSGVDLRKLCAAGGLLARVARADSDVSAPEFGVMAAALQPSGLGLSGEEAGLIAEIALSESVRDMDFTRLVRDFFGRTTPEERRSFVHVLLALAEADDVISAEEDLEIESLALSLHLTRREYLQIRKKYR